MHENAYYYRAVVLLKKFTQLRINTNECNPDYAITQEKFKI